MRSDNLFRQKAGVTCQRSHLQARKLSKPVDVGTVKIGQYIIVDGEPCKVVEFEKSKPGKHGAAKARIVAMSVTTGTKKNVISPVDARIDVPMIEKKTGQVPDD